MAQYSNDEMEAIVRRALERQGTGDGFTHDDLMAVATEMGLPPAEVGAAAAEVKLERDRLRWEGEAKARRRRRFLSRLGTYTVINGALLAVDAMTGSGWWIQWVILGTGIHLAFHGLRLSRPVNEREVERERRREQRQERRRARELRRLNRERDPAQDFEVIVERGAEMLRDVIERYTHTERRRGGSGERSEASASPRSRARVEPDSASPAEERDTARDTAEAAHTGARSRRSSRQDEP